MAKFKQGDIISPIELFRGFERATIQKVDDEFYYLKIMNGNAIIPISAETNYQLSD